ncbi:hypothetical protein FB45DRAFT_997362 [Roridomyces roridus]|uniref:Uncharacterized protein n=1 Tax=Roridomyces roridus TaxID=1738132 RepID=A0AAD7CJ49_9AGAR|nr:hypothetical protein FB45DRAFT_997362 [Roridomyces roridus]
MLLSRAALTRRVHSRALSSYSPKVRAYPFAISATDAVADVGLTPAVNAGLFDRILTFLGMMEPAKPEKIVPVYFPAWFIDAEVEFNASAPTDTGNVNGRLTAVFLNSYLPGHTMDKVSTISFLSPTLSLCEPVPFSSELETQHGMKVTCLPFKTVPFPVVDLARSLDSERLVVDGMRIDPSSISANLFAAYPVLIPLYLAQYSLEPDEEDTDPIGRTVLVEAHDTNGRIIAEMVDGEIMAFSSRLPPRHPPPPELADSSLYKMLDNAEQRVRRRLEEMQQDEGTAEDMMYCRGDPATFHNISSITLPPKWRIPNLQQHTAWLDKFATAEGIQQLVTGGKLDSMDDPRIRPWTADERNDVRAFFTLGQERSNAYAFLQGLSSIKTKGGIAGDTFQEMEKYAQKFDSQREEATPSWWREWLDSTKKK